MLLGRLSAGAHTYSIVATDKVGNRTVCTDSFTVVPNTGPAISCVRIVEATGSRNGTPTTSERLLMTFNAVDSNGVARATVRLDGRNVTPVRGPFTASTGGNFRVLLGRLSAGAHTYTIVATDKAGSRTAYTGSFTVEANTGPMISNVQVVQAAGSRGGTPTANESLLLAFNALDPDGVASATVRLDGKNATPVRGPYKASTGVDFGVLLGKLSAGNHSYSIVATDKAGSRTSYTGSFTVAALTVDASNPPRSRAQSLTDQQLATIAQEAQRRLAMAGGAQVLAAMANVTIKVADLPHGLLGETVGKTILIDRDAAGFGWFIDPTPADDLEFAAVPGPHALTAANDSAAAQRVDLLTAVMHEMGHVLGFEHSDASDLMYSSLSLGTRRLLSEQTPIS